MVEDSAARERLLIVGASVRAAAFSAASAGWRPRAIDLFADADTRCVAEARAVSRYPDELAEQADELEAGVWMYTGGIENHPQVVDRISRRHRLLGNTSETLVSVRDPAAWEARLRGLGVNVPRAWFSAAEPPPNVACLKKHRRSSGGSRVAAWNGEELESCWYLQERIAGESAAAAFVAAAGSAVFLGATSQRIGRAHGGEATFAYAGSTYPAQVFSDAEEAMRRVGTIAARAGVVGVFGVDFIVHGDEAWPIEVNPRYTASMEVLERAGLPSAVGLHVRACRDRSLPPADAWRLAGAAAKRIVFATRPLVIDERFTRRCFERNEKREWPVIADIPTPGTALFKGQPVLTALASGQTREGVEAELRAILAEVDGWMADA